MPKSESAFSFTHLRVELRGLTLGGEVWNEGDLIPIVSDSTPDPILQAVLESAAAGAHPHLTAGNVKDGEFVPITGAEKAK